MIRNDHLHLIHHDACVIRHDVSMHTKLRISFFVRLLCLELDCTKSDGKNIKNQNNDNNDGTANIKNENKKNKKSNGKIKKKGN